MSTVYSYYSTNGQRAYVEDDDVLLLGGWAGTNTYTATPAPFQVASYGNGLYICLTTGSNQPPQGGLPYWSPLVVISENPVPPDPSAAAYALAFEAYVIGTNAAQLAEYALEVAEAGTSNTGTIALGLAEFALTIAEYGTNTGTAAYNLALSASQSLGQVLPIIYAGTNIPPLSTLPDVTITNPTADQVLTFNGSSWINDAPTSTNTVSPYQISFYAVDTPSGTLAYNTLASMPTINAQSTDTSAVSSGTITPIKSYISSPLERTSVSAGLWIFNTFASVNTGNSSYVVIDVFTRGITGNETYLFSGTSPALTSTAGLAASITVQGTFATSLTDALLAKYSALTQTPGGVIVSLYSGGTSYFTNFTVPFVVQHNQLQGLQGGGINDYWHLTGSQFSGVADATAGPTSGSNPLVTTSDPRLALAVTAFQNGTSTAIVATNGSNLAAEALSIAIAGTVGLVAANQSIFQVEQIAVSGSTTANNAVSLAIEAFDNAASATTTANAANATAATALSIVASGSNLAVEAYTIAVAGTIGVAAANQSIFQVGTTANTALTVATSGSNLAVEAFRIAIVGSNAYPIATSGSNLAVEAYTIAVVGSNATAIANEALNVADLAISIATSASNTANAISNIAVSGSNLAVEALLIAIIGTNEATTALSVATSGSNLAYSIITTGTVSSSALIPYTVGTPPTPPFPTLPAMAYDPTGALPTMGWDNTPLGFRPTSQSWN